MSRLLNRFRGLQWRFALSYMLVTALSVLAVPVLYSAAGYIFDIRSTNLPRQMAASLEGYAQFSLPYLVQQPIDRAGLQSWLIDFDSNGRVQGNGSFADLWISGPPYGTSQLAVVDAAGRVIVSTSDPDLPAGALAATRLTAAGQQVLHAALAGDERPHDLATPELNGRALIAVPIKMPGRLMGAVVLDLDVAGVRSSYLPRTAQGLLGFLVLVSVLAGLLGLIFGFIVSRGMTRRLKRIAAAAGAWSHGDFSVTARDPSGDELGQLARDLNQMAEQVQTLLEDRRQLAVADERNRLARELHDAVKQQVFATGMQIAAAEALAERDPAATKARLAEAGRLISQAQQELNALIRELRPAALGDKGLAAALRDLCAEWSAATGIAAEVRITGEQSAPLEVEQALFRVAQEAISNVARHSGASRADVRLAWEGDELTLTVADNGHGFELAERNGAGVGLGSMQERVEALGGMLAISSGTTGTKIEARVPLPPPPRSQAPAGNEARTLAAAEKGADV